MQPFLHRIKKPIVVFILPILLLACASPRVVRLTVPVEEAVTVGRLTQPRDRPASERVLLVAPGKPVRVGEITRVRIIGSSGRSLGAIPLPFWAEEQKGHLVIEERDGHLRGIPLTSIDRLEVESLLPPEYWQPTDYLILTGFTLLVVLFGGISLLLMVDRHDD